MIKKLEETLIVGLDDSNHAGTTKGEIIAGVFSTIHGDSLVTRFPNKRDYDSLQPFFENENRDYNFTILTSELYRHSNQNLIALAPFLIKSYLKSSGKNFRNLKLYLDGQMNLDGKRFIRNNIPYFEKIVVDNFIKKERIKDKIVKRHNCPKVVYIADTLANSLFRTPAGELFQNKCFVPFR